MRLSIRSKLVVAFLAFSLAPMVALLVFSDRIITTGFERMAQLRISSALDGIRADLDHRIEDLGNRTVQVAGSDELVKKLLIVDEGRIDHRGLIDLAAASRQSVGLSLLEVYDNNGVSLAKGHNRADFGMRADASDSHNREVMLVIGDGEARFTLGPERILDHEELALKVFAPITHRGQIKGVLMGGQVVDDDFLARMRALASAVIMILNEDGVALSSRDMEGGLINESAVELDPNPGSEDLYSARINDVDYIFGMLPLRGREHRDYFIAAGVSNKELGKLVKRLHRVLIRTLLAVLAVALAAGAYISYRVSKPVRALVSGARDVASGNLDVEVQAGGGDEVGELISAFNQMTADLKVNRERLLSAERIAAWKDIARRIAHEIKNPLFPIQLSIQGLQKSYAEGRPDFPEVFDESTSTVLEEVDRLRRLADEFSQFARMPSPVFRAVDINDAVRGTLALFRDVPENIGIESRLPEDLPMARADRDQLTQVILNLVKNAMEAMPGGGRIVVESGIGVRPESAARKKPKKVDEYEPGMKAVKIAVSDTGAGIPREQIRDIFTPYYTTKESGTGLGLAIVKRVVDDHGGWIEVTTSLGQGTAIAVYLPIWEESSEQSDDTGD